VQAVYWTKGERFVAVEPTLEASAFLDGAPKRGRELRLVASPVGGSSRPKPGVLGAKERRMDFDVLVNCCHGGPGEDGTLQAALDLAGVAYTGPAAAAATLCMDKLAFGAVVQRPGCRRSPAGSCSRGAKRWLGTAGMGTYIVKPRFGGSSIGIEVIEDWADVVRYAGARRVPTLSGGCVAEPFRAEAYDVNVSVRGYPVMALSLFDPAPAARRRRPDPVLLGQVPGWGGMVSAPRELPRSSSRASKGSCGTPP